jgi:hypothetical protein
VSDTARSQSERCLTPLEASGRLAGPGVRNRIVRITSVG